MRGIVCRGLRLELVAGLGLALAIPALASSGASTTTSLTVQSSTVASSTDVPCALTGLTVNVTGTSVASKTYDGTTTATLSALWTCSPLANTVTSVP